MASGGLPPIEALRGLPPGSRVEVRDPDGGSWTGTIVPTGEGTDPSVVQIKLESGYNVGIRIRPSSVVRVLGPIEREAPANAAPAPVAKAGTVGATVTLLTTGGTIASRVDYRTGGVRPVQSESEILAFYPDLAADGPVRIERVLDRLSEEIAPTDWEALAERTAAAFHDGAHGVVIAHGTDTMGFSAAALGFLLADLQGPVVLVGAQRSPDRPSSDGVSNLSAAVRLARDSDLGEVVVVMHADLSDERFAIHRGTRVRKMHASRRDAFRSLNGTALGTIDGAGVHFSSEYRVRSAGPTRVTGRLDPRATMVWFHPGLDPQRLAEGLQGLRGVVLAGTGLGHVSSAHLPWIRDAVARGVVVVMTTQCLGGSADPFVYATGRELLRSGALYAGDLLPETAFVKLLWALGQSADPAEVRRLIVAERAGEFTPRHTVEAS